VEIDPEGGQGRTWTVEPWKQRKRLGREAASSPQYSTETMHKCSYISTRLPKTFIGNI
jgi:hypothetical protein